MVTDLDGDTTISSLFREHVTHILPRASIFDQRSIATAGIFDQRSTVTAGIFDQSS